MQKHPTVIVLLILSMITIALFFVRKFHTNQKTDLSFLIKGDHIERSYDQKNKLDIIQSESNETLENLKQYYLNYFQSNDWNVVNNTEMPSGGYRINALKGKNSVGVFFFKKDDRYVTVLAQHYEQY